MIFSQVSRSRSVRTTVRFWRALSSSCRRTWRFLLDCQLDSGLRIRPRDPDTALLVSIETNKWYSIMMLFEPTRIVLFAAVVVLCLSMQMAIPASATEILFDGDEKLSRIVSPLPYTYIEKDSLPKSFQWGDVEGKSFLTHMLNQHIPQVRSLFYLVVVMFPRNDSVLTQ